MNWQLPQWVERWLSNLALFFGLTVVCGLAVGLLAALFGSGTVDGSSGTIVTHDDDGTTSVSTPTDDPAPGMLILMPFLIVAGSIFFALPFAVALLGLGEVACVAGAPATIVRQVG